MWQCTRKASKHRDLRPKHFQQLCTHYSFVFPAVLIRLFLLQQPVHIPGHLFSHSLGEGRERNKAGEAMKEGVAAAPPGCRIVSAGYTQHSSTNERGGRENVAI